ncbi:MAG: LPS assembly lipoprotein LptE [Methylophilaceae bacterium]|nr:LPS assembly lipoprotein LptE [Methyloradius sp.]
MHMLKFNHLRFTHLWVAIFALMLAACGFQMRGMADLAFHTLYIKNNNLSISKSLKKTLAVNGVTIVNNPEKAELMLELMDESTQKKILSLSGGGLVREFEIFYRLNFRLRDPSNELWGPMQTLEARRDYTYDDTQLLAKQSEEGALYDDMRKDVVNELLRRLIVQKPKSAVSQ